MEEKKKSKLGLGILIGLLIAVIIGLTGFIVYDKVLLSDDGNQQIENSVQNDNNESEQSKEVTVTLTSVEQENLLSKIDTYNKYIGLTKNYPISDVNNLDNNLKIDFLYMQTLDSYAENFTENDLKATANNYFYSGFTFDNENIICSIDNEIEYMYNSSTGDYIYNEEYIHGHEGPNLNRSKSYYVGGTYNETTKLYTFNIKVLYADICAGICEPTKGYYSDNKLSNLVYRVDDQVEDFGSFDEVYNNVKEELLVTQYSFYKNSDGNFVLKSVQ